MLLIVALWKPYFWVAFSQLLLSYFYLAQWIGYHLYKKNFFPVHIFRRSLAFSLFVCVRCYCECVRICVYILGTVILGPLFVHICVSVCVCVWIQIHIDTMIQHPIANVWGLPLLLLLLKIDIFENFILLLLWTNKIDREIERLLNKIWWCVRLMYRIDKRASLGYTSAPQKHCKFLRKCHFLDWRFNTKISQTRAVTVLDHVF